MNHQEYLLELRDISKIFSGQKSEITALNKVSLCVRSGELVVVVGPSGCGKSTLLRCIVGLEEPNEGDIFINGLNMTTKPPEERLIEWLPQRIESTFIIHKSLNFNMELGLKIRKVSEADREKQINKVSSLLGINHLLNRRPYEISGGELQRAAIGRALMRDSNIFLFDEPLANLDEQRRRELRQEFRKIQKKVNGAFVYVTHDQKEALSIGTRCVVMNSGEILQDDSPENIYNSPNSLFVARFFSANGLNEFPCKIILREKGYNVEGDFFQFLIPTKEKTQKKERQAIFCVRAEDVKRRPNGKFTESEISFGKTKVIDKQFFGNEAFIITTRGSANSMKIIAKDSEAKNQDIIELCTYRNRIYLFDADTQQRIS
ncbi:MAG: ABC transporter ATP-binding protein [Candidatus Thorarchaeota archaeon]